MRRLPLIIIGVAAVIIVVLVYHQKLLTAVHFVMNRPYSSLSNEDLEARIAGMESELASISSVLDGLPSDPGNRSLQDHASAHGMRDRASDLLRDRDDLLAEQSWRQNRTRWLFFAGFVISLLGFIHINRKVSQVRDPGIRRREKFNRELDKKRVDELQELERSKLSARLEQVDPRLSRLIPGVSTRKEVQNLLGVPLERTIFMEMEAWIYYLPGTEGHGGVSMGLSGEAAPEDDVWGVLEKEASDPRSRQDLTPVTVLFKGNLVHDLSIGTVSEKDKKERTL